MRRPNARTGATVLFDAFLRWCSENNCSPISQQEFGSYLGHRGFGRKKTSGTYVYLDLLLNTPDVGEKGGPGTRGTTLPVDRSTQPHEEGNGGSGPSGPQSSLDADLQGATACDQPPPRDRELTPGRWCGDTRRWRLKVGGPLLCPRCHPPQPNPEEIEWFDAVVGRNGSAHHA